MGELERDDVPTPITKVSNAPSTPIVENQPDQVAPSKSDGLLAPASILKKGGSGAETPTTEAPESPSSNAIPILRSPSPSPLVDKGTVYENGTIYENLLPPLPRLRTTSDSARDPVPTSTIPTHKMQPRGRVYSLLD
uniref:Uncharacterized protein n=1 Tax=Bionectria ochroleuca TaxID=29856 RepID=A0A8H7KAT5_BIOOC